MVIQNEELELPQNIYTGEEVNSLPPAERRRYFKQFLLDVMRLNPDGFTAAALVRALNQRGLNYSKRTLEKHLDYLVLIREAYSKKHGPSTVFYLNGRLLWDKRDKQKNALNLGMKTYNFYELENPRGKFIIIQEKEKDGFNIETVTGGIVVPKDAFSEFLSHLGSFDEDMKRDDAL